MGISASARRASAALLARPREQLAKFAPVHAIPAIGAIFIPEGSDEEDPPGWDTKLTGTGLQRANERWRKERDERHAEFRWLLGLSTEPVGHVVNLDDARARRASG